MLQRLLSSKAFTSSIGAAMAAYIRLVRRTSKVSDDPPDFIEKSLPDTPLIIAMWHGQGLLLPFIRPRDDIKVAIMVAKHIDGDIVHETLRRFGMTTIRGAGAGRKGKDKGGFAALRACMKALRNDTTVALTADIPPGPARKAGLGLVTLSKLSGRAILPCAVVTNRHLKLNTWSGFTVNLPFSSMVMTGGEQIRVPRHASDEELEVYRRRLEDSLNEVTGRAYRLSGRPEKGVANENDASGYGRTLRTYVRLTRLFQPSARLLLKIRERQGKEESQRISERLGMASTARRPGPLVWLHAASVGETIAVLNLIERMLESRPGLQVLLTTGTVTSAKLARTRLPEGAVHQYIPLDAPDFISRFLDYWKPDAVILTESEIWPNLIREARQRKVPLLLVNGRMSPRSFRRWRRRFKIARPLFGSLDLVLAQNDRYAGYFERLGARYVVAAGNLKLDAPPPPANKESLARLKTAVGKRQVFLAASTHPGEEDIVAQVHERLKTGFPDLLTIIVPRHPDRGAEIASQLDVRALKSALRSRKEALDSKVDVYIADTIGELGLFYALSPVAFIGGSLVPHGGQNPIEAIAHGTAILSGPEVHNFKESYATLVDAGACIEVNTAEELAAQAGKLLRDEQARKQLVSSAQAEVARMQGALDATLVALEPYLPSPKERKRAS